MAHGWVWRFFYFNIRRLCFIPFTSPRGRNIYVEAFKRFMTVVIIFRKCLLSIIPKQTSKRQQPNLFPASHVWGKKKWKKGGTFSRSTGSAMCRTFLKNRCGSSPFIEWKEVPGRHCESKWREFVRSKLKDLLYSFSTILLWVSVRIVDNSSLIPPSSSTRFFMLFFYFSVCIAQNRPLSRLVLKL